MTRHINLLDPPKKVRSPWTTPLLMSVPVALVVLVMAVWASVASYKLGAVQKQVADIEEQIRPVRERLTQLQDGLGVDQVNAGLRDRLARAEGQLKSRKDIQTALQRGELGSTQGFSEFMRAFARQPVAGLWLTGLKLESGGLDITLTGRAVSAEAVATLLSRLRAEPALAGRAIATLSVTPVVAENAEEGASTPAAQALVYEFQISSVVAEREGEAASTGDAAANGVRGAVAQIADGMRVRDLK